MADPKRVLVRISDGSPHWPHTCEEPMKDLMQHALDIIKEHGLAPVDAPNESVLLVAVDKWNKRASIVFDVFHDAYDPVNAHLPKQNDLPLIVVSLSKQHASLAGAPIANQVNKEVRELHDTHGLHSRAPFYVDHSDGRVPCYPNPRSRTRGMIQTPGP